MLEIPYFTRKAETCFILTGVTESSQSNKPSAQPVNSLLPSEAIWDINLGQDWLSGNVLLPNGTKPLPGPILTYHDDVIKWKHFPRYLPFVQGIHRSPVNSPHKGQWRRALMFSLICVWINGWVNKREAGDLRRHCAHYDVTVMSSVELYGTHLRPISQEMFNISICNWKIHL